jgi:hypothetical protein
MRRVRSRLALLVIMFLVTVDSVGLPISIVAINHVVRNTARIEHNAVTTGALCRGENTVDAILVTEILGNIQVVLKSTPPAERPAAKTRMLDSAYALRPKKC